MRDLLIFKALRRLEARASELAGTPTRFYQVLHGFRGNATFDLEEKKSLSWRMVSRCRPRHDPRPHQYRQGDQRDEARPPAGLGCFFAAGS